MKVYVGIPDPKEYNSPAGECYWERGQLKQ